MKLFEKKRNLKNYLQTRVQESILKKIKDEEIKINK